MRKDGGVKMDDEDGGWRREDGGNYVYKLLAENNVYEIHLC